MASRWTSRNHRPLGGVGPQVLVLLGQFLTLGAVFARRLEGPLGLGQVGQRALQLLGGDGQGGRLLGPQFAFDREQLLHRPRV